MLIQKIPITQICPAKYNPRQDLKPGDPEYDKLKKSIKKFGYVVYLVWNKRTGNLISGHQRLKILIELGFTEVEVIVVDLSLADEKALNLALNKISGEWEQDKLAQMLEELKTIPDFDIELTGFDLPEISEIIDQFHEPPDDDNFNFQEAIDSIKESITNPGDLIELGPHRVLCGDSSDPNSLQKLMGLEKANLLHCDYPYNVNYGGGERPNPHTRPKKSKRWERIYSDNMPQKEYEDWMRRILVNIKQFLVPGSAVYIWQGHRQFPPLYQILLELDFHISCIICWMKESAALSYADYSFQTEQALYGFLRGAPHYWAGKPGATNLWQVKRDPTKTYGHPTQKPVALPAKAITNSSKRGDIVLDTFLGSGSTLIAAESLQRRCYGIEIDPKYCDGIVRRYIALVGKNKVSQQILEKYIQEGSK